MASCGRCALWRRTWGPGPYGACQWEAPALSWAYTFHVTRATDGADCEMFAAVPHEADTAPGREG